MLVNLNILERDALNFNPRVTHQIGGSFWSSMMRGISKLATSGSKKAIDMITSESTKKLVKDMGKKAIDSAVSEAGPAVGKFVGQKATQVLNKVQAKVPVQFQEQVVPVIEQGRQLVDPALIDQEVQKLSKKFRAMKGMSIQPKVGRRKIVDFI